MYNELNILKKDVSEIINKIVNKNLCFQHLNVRLNQLIDVINSKTISQQEVYTILSVTEFNFRMFYNIWSYSGKFDSSLLESFLDRFNIVNPDFIVNLYNSYNNYRNIDQSINKLQTIPDIPRQTESNIKVIHILDFFTDMVLTPPDGCEYLYIDVKKNVSNVSCIFNNKQDILVYISTAYSPKKEKYYNKLIKNINQIAIYHKNITIINDCIEDNADKFSECKWIKDNIIAYPSKQTSVENFNVRKRNDGVVTKHEYCVPFYDDFVSNKLEDKWWYKHYIRTEGGCGFSRMMQIKHAGICWFNSITNMLILDENILVDVIKKLSCRENKIESLANLKCRIEFKEILLALATSGFDLKKKVIKEYILALLNNALYSSEDLKEENIDTAVCVKIASEAKLTDLTMTYFPARAVSLVLSAILNNNYVDLSVDNLDDITDFTCKCLSISSQKYILIKIKNQHKGKLPELNNYELTSCVMINRPHAICGFTCGGESYVYDSMNILAKSEWKNFDLSGYYKKMKEVTYLPNIFDYVFNILLYVRKDPKHKVIVFFLLTKNATTATYYNYDRTQKMEITADNKIIIDDKIERLEKNIRFDRLRRAYPLLITDDICDNKEVFLKRTAECCLASNTQKKRGGTSYAYVKKGTVLYNNKLRTLYKYKNKTYIKVKKDNKYVFKAYKASNKDILIRP